MCRAVTTALLLCSSTEEEALFMKHKSSSSALSPPTSHSRLSTRPHSSNSAISLWQNFCSVCLKILFFILCSSIAQKTSQTIYEFDTILSAIFLHFPGGKKARKEKQFLPLLLLPFHVMTQKENSISEGITNPRFSFTMVGWKRKSEKKEEEESSRERKIPSGKVRCAISFLSHLSSPLPWRRKLCGCLCQDDAWLKLFSPFLIVLGNNKHKFRERLFHSFTQLGDKLKYYLKFKRYRRV